MSDIDIAAPIYKHLSDYTFADREHTYISLGTIVLGTIIIIVLFSR